MMAEKTPEKSRDAKEDSVTPTEPDSTTPEIALEKPTPKNHRAPKFSASIVPVWGWVVGAFVVLFALVGFVASGYALIHGVKNDASTSTRSGRDYALRGDQFGNVSNENSNGSTDGTTGMTGGPGGGFGMMRGESGNSSTRISGVVTAVDGDTLTVAGNGTTVTVKVTDSTTYSGSSKPATVNDSIVAVGTTSDDVFTATSIRLTR